jgi:2-dehydropantoate 2-reductase
VKRVAVVGPGAAAVARALALECLAVARAEGAALPDSVADEPRDWYADLPPDAGSSILADREAGRPLESRGSAHFSAVCAVN